MSIRILLADDHAIVRDGLRAVLERAGFGVVGEASDGREAVRLVKELMPDVAVLDLAMPSLNGVDAARAIHEVSPRTRTVLLTMHAEHQLILDALRAGVRGYVLKSHAASDLVRAIEDAAAGGVYLSSSISRVLLDAYLSNAAVPPDPLTPLERQVLQLVAEGHTTKEVARTLGLTIKSAEAHRARIMRKLDIHDTAGLVRYAIRRGLTLP
jgi:DNA-binding NarL/FixJ family response regulator